MSKVSNDSINISKDKFYQVYGSNKLWCNKRIITGEKYYNLFFTFFSYFIPYILSLILFVYLKPMKNLLNIIYIIISSILFIISVYSMLRCGCSDPGILPKQKANLNCAMKKEKMKLRIGGHILVLNFCYTCNIFRPPRTSHCSRCDNCVERFDHHCNWLGNCIGKRNYKNFYALLLSLNLNSFFQIGFCVYILVIGIKKIKSKEKNGYILSIIMGCLVLYNVLFIIIFIGKFIGEYTYLLLKDITYIEYKKKKFKIYPKGVNPYKKYNLCSNKSIVCLKRNKSKIRDIIEQLENQDSIIINKKYKHKRNEQKEENNKIQIRINKEFINDNFSESRTKMKFLNTYQYQPYTIKKFASRNEIFKKDEENLTNDNNIYISKIKEENDNKIKVNESKDLKRLKRFIPSLEYKDNIFFDKGSFYSDINYTIKSSDNDNKGKIKRNKKAKNKSSSCKTNIKDKKIMFSNI